MDRSNYWQRSGWEGFWRRRSSRRGVLRGGVLGLGALAFASACGTEEDEEAPPAATQATGGATQPAGGATPAQPAAGEAKQGGSLVTRNAADPPSFSLLQASANSAGFANHVYSKLVNYATGANLPSNAFTVEPDLAQAMPEQPDEVTYVFKIHEGVTFQDKPPVGGRALTAEDVKTSIDTYRGEGSPWVPDWALIDSVEAVDETTVRVNMSEPYAPFLNLAAGHYGLRVFPPEMLEGDRMQTDAVGSGPYMLDRFEQGNRAVYRRNPNYFKEGRPYLDEITILIIPEQSSATAAFQTGQIHIVGVPCHEADQVEGAVQDAVRRDALGLGGYVAFNTSNPPFDDERVRQAVSLAYDREAENQALHCGLARPDGLIPQGITDRALSPEEFGEGAQYYQHNPEQARQLLDAAGVPDGFETSAVFTPAYGQTYASELELAIGQFAEVGIQVTPRSVEYGQWISEVYRGGYNFDGMLWGYIRSYPDPEPYVWYWLHPDGITNQSRVDDPEITELLVQQRAELDPDARWEILGQIERLNAQKMYYAGRTTRASTSLWRGWLGGYSPLAPYDRYALASAYDTRL